MLPPITSAYKRKYEDEDEYDSEMDDFIDDGGDEQEEISKHIKEIFGYDRSRWASLPCVLVTSHVIVKFYRTDFLFALNFLRYKDESDYALKFMETSWKEMQKEEAKR